MLGVRPDEVDRVRRLMGVSFLLGTALVLFYGAGNAVFLTRYDITALPWVYIVNAGVVIVVGLVYGAWSSRVRVDQALVGLAGAMSVSVFALWVWAVLSDGRAVAFAMAVWFRLLFIFAVLGLWEIASAVFDIRQAKRLFAAVALGMMLAFVVGGIATSSLTAAFGTVNLIGVSAACFTLYTIAFRRLLRRYEVGRRDDGETAAAATPREIMSDRYSRRLVWMKSVTILLLYVSEYVFYEQAAGTFDTEDSLAGFLGLFMGSMTIVMVLVTGLVSGRYIGRFGIRTATLTLPVGMLLIAVPTGLYGTLVGVDTVFFALVAGVLATNHVLGNAISEPAGAVLFQPIPQARRMRVRLAVDGWLGSVALLFAGLLLLAFNALDSDSMAPYLFVVAAIALVGVVMAVLQYRDYVGALRGITTIGFARETLVPDDGRDTVAVALSTLGAGADQLWSGLIGHGSPDVVELALGAVARSGDRSAADDVEDVLDRTELPRSTRVLALTTLAELDPERATARSRAILSGEAPDLALAVALADPDLRADAERRLLDLLDHGDAQEVDAALDAAIGQATPAIAARAVDCLAEPLHRRRAIAVLAGADAAARQLAVAALPQLPDEVVADVVEHVLAPAGDHDGVVAQCLAPHAASVVRRAGYLALAGDHRSVPIRDHLADDLALVAMLVAAGRDLGNAEPVVTAALEQEFLLARRSIYAALGVEYDSTRLADIETLVRTGSEDDRANAIEALDVLLAADHRRTVVAALEPVDAADAVASLAGLPPSRPVADWMQSLATDRRLTPWTRRVAGGGRDTSLTRSDGCTDMDPITARVLALAGIDIFSTLSYGSLLELAEGVQSQTVDPGATVIDVGSLGRELYAITRGTVEVRTADGATSLLEEGTVFGELAILDPAPRSATVTAVTEVDLLVVPRATVLALADRRPEVMSEIARVLARRLRARA